MYIEQDKEKPLMKIINSLGGWDVLRSFNLYNWDQHRVLRELHSEYGANAFFRVDVVPDVHNPGQNVIQVAPDGLGMPDKTYYHRFPNDSAIQVPSCVLFCFQSQRIQILISIILIFRS